MATGKTNVQKEKKTRRKGLKGDKEFLNRLILALKEEKLTKTQLANKLNEDEKLITDSVFLEAVFLTGNSKFLENLIKEPAGRRESDPQYKEGKGLLITRAHFRNRGVLDGQKYRIEFGRKGIITLRPVGDDGNDQTEV